MSKKHEDAEEKGKKGKKGLVVKAALGLGLIAAGGGAAFGMMQAGVIGGHGEKEDNSPKLILKGEEDPYAPPSKEKEGEGGGDVFGEGGSKYRTIYYSFADDFTSNLKHSDALVQVSLAASTQGCSASFGSSTGTRGQRVTGRPSASVGDRGWPIGCARARRTAPAS